MRLSAVAGLAAILLSSNVQGYQVQTPPLDTPWTYKVGTNPWPEHPRPLLQRSQWQNLNGVWKWGPSDGSNGAAVPASGALTADVLIPSCLESGISGVQVLNQTYAWFTREFTIPSDWSKDGGRILLNFEAVDYEATIFVNGQQAGHNVGGYWHFTVDVTQFVTLNGTNQLHVYVYDPTDMPGVDIPIGKQSRTPSHIFYRSCTGIWQTVWLEHVPDSYIRQLDISADMDGKVTMTVNSTGTYSGSVTVSVIGEDGDVIATHEGGSNVPFTFVVDSPKLWSPSSPTLYNLTVKLGSDEVTSYTGFRTISRGIVNGIQRPLLNGEFIFQFGTLDQGFWPDGIYTPPSVEAMTYDLQVLKNLGFNMLRKHIKVEPALFYHQADKLGLLIIQDMPALQADGSVKPNLAEQLEFNRQFELLINQHKSFPSIITWVVYNEGWGQVLNDSLLGTLPEYLLTDRARQLDPTRLVDSTTGWYDHGAGDFSDSEFGGIGHNVSIDHLWNVQQAINAINNTYEINADLDSYNYRAHLLLSELHDQVVMFACSGAVWTQTTDVEGEVNGLLTYDRRVLRPYTDQWKDDIQALYAAAEARSNGNVTARMFL